MVKATDWIFIENKLGDDLIKANVGRKIVKGDIVELRINIHITQEKNILVKED